MRRTFLGPWGFLELFLRFPYSRTQRSSAAVTNKGEGGTSRREPLVCLTYHGYGSRPGNGRGDKTGLPSTTAAGLLRRGLVNGLVDGLVRCWSESIANAGAAA